jgi:hypothetical protein
MTLQLSDKQPHFGFLRAGAVYTQTISLKNVDVQGQSLRFLVLPPTTSTRRDKSQNRLRVFVRDIIALAPGMSIDIDLVLLAAKPAKFSDVLEVSELRSSQAHGAPSCP